MLSNLIAAGEQGNHLDETELIANCTLMLHVSHHSTTATIASGILHLLRHPDQLVLLRAHPEFAESAVEGAATLRDGLPDGYTRRQHGSRA